MSNYVTTPANSGGQPRTPVDHRSRSEAYRPKVRRSLQLLRDEEVVGSNPPPRHGSQPAQAATCPTTEKRCSHSGQVASPKA